MRDKRIQLRVSAEEHARILSLAKARGMTVADFVRHSVLHGLPPAIPEINRTALVELQRIGGNLNQISRRLNFKRGDLADIDIDDLRALLGQLRLALLEARK